jgi:hypothetical protein
MDTVREPSRRRSPFPVVIAVLALAMVACAAGGGAPKGSGRATSLDQAKTSAAEGGPSALDDPAARGLPKPLVDPADIRSGGPPPDGIPAVDRPRFEKAGAVRWLDDREPVLALDLSGQARAYPVQILVWHEIVNDTVGDMPVAVTYCPLCNSALAFDRRVAGRVVDFGTSGKLYNSDLVMYDRQTKSLWVQFLGKAVAGRLTGTKLRAYPVATVSWRDWRAAHPDGWVLSRDTGFSRGYGTNPYPGYDDVGSSPFLVAGKTDGRLAAKDRVVGIRRGTDAVAVVTSRLRIERVQEVEVGGQAVVMWLSAGTASALDSDQVRSGRDVGASGAFDPVVDGRHLHFEPAGDGFRDQETGTTWDVLGRATGGSLAGRSLTAVEHVDTFWFAWAAFVPKTRIVP